MDEPYLRGLSENLEVAAKAFLRAFEKETGLRVKGYSVDRLLESRVEGGDPMRRQVCLTVEY